MYTPRGFGLVVACVLILSGASAADDEKGPRLNMPSGVMSALGPDGRAELEEACDTLDDLVQHCRKLLKSKRTTKALSDSWVTSVSNSSQYVASKCAAAREALVARAKRRRESKALLASFDSRVGATQKVLDELFANQGTRLVRMLRAHNQTSVACLQLVIGMPRFLVLHHQEMRRSDQIIRRALGAPRTARTVQALRSELDRLRVARNLVAANARAIGRFLEATKTSLDKAKPSVLEKGLRTIIKRMEWPAVGATLFNDIQLTILRDQVLVSQVKWGIDYSKAWGSAVKAIKPFEDGTLIKGLSSFEGRPRDQWIKAVDAAEGVLKTSIASLKMSLDAAAEIRKAQELAEQARKEIEAEAAVALADAQFQALMARVERTKASLRKSDPTRHRSITDAVKELKALQVLQLRLYSDLADALCSGSGRALFSRLLSDLGAGLGAQARALKTLDTHQKDSRNRARQLVQRIRRVKDQLYQLAETIDMDLVEVEKDTR